MSERIARILKEIRLLRLSIRILGSHPLRAAVTMVAIAMGIGAVIVLDGTGRAVEGHVTQALEALGGSVLTVYPSQLRSSGGRVYAVSFSLTLSERDAKTLGLLQGVLEVGAIVEGQSTVTGDGRKAQNVRVIGLEPTIAEIRRILDCGRTFGDEENHVDARVVVLSNAVESELFGTGCVLDATVRIDGVPFRVIGVSQDPLVPGPPEAYRRTAYIPLRAAMHRLYGRTHLDSIVVRPERSEPIEDTVARIRAELRRDHGLRGGQRDDFSVVRNSAQFDAEVATASTLSGFISIVATVSLTTGVLGEFILMLLVVRERSAEIGLRRALGARKVDIFIQFLLESVIVAGIAACIGVLSGLVASHVVCVANGWPVAWPTSAVAAGAGLAVAVAVVAGSLPATIAARLEPDRALRA